MQLMKKLNNADKLLIRKKSETTICICNSESTPQIKLQ